MPRSSRAGWASRASPAARASRSTSQPGRSRSATTSSPPGDIITIDGGTGSVIVGAVPLVPPAIDENFGTILELGRRAPASAACARTRTRRRMRRRRASSAPRASASAGPSTCSWREDRLPIVREMILARDEEERRGALERLLPMQQGDFEGIFEAMAGLPVTIRLLDPPLHEFLPSLEEATSDAMRDRIRQLHEANPMLGTRGCRLGLQFPEIYEMQVRAIVRGARRRSQERTGEAPLVEIMHPLVGFRRSSRGSASSPSGSPPRTPSVEYLLRHDDRAPARRASARTRSRRRPTSSPSGRTTSRRRRSASHATTPRASSSRTTSSTASSSGTRSR